MDSNQLGRLIKVREVGESGNAFTRWIALEDAGVSAGQVVVREGGQAIFDQPNEPADAEPGDFWIQED